MKEKILNFTNNVRQDVYNSFKQKFSIFDVTTTTYCDCLGYFLINLSSDANLSKSAEQRNVIRICSYHGDPFILININELDKISNRS